MQICYCKGYESLVIPFSFLSKNEEVIIYARSDDIIKVCQYFNIPFIRGVNFNLRELLLFPDIVKKRILRSLKKRINLKKAEFHFMHKNSDILEFIMMGVLATQECSVYFHKLEKDFEADFPPIKYGLKWLIIKKLLKLYYNVDITIREEFNRVIPVLKRKCLNDFGVKFVDYESIQQFFYKTYMNFNNLNLPKCKNLFLYPSIAEISTWVTKESLYKLLKFIEGFEIYYKFHPNRAENVRKKIKTYPSFLPAELLVKLTEKNVIGIWSSVFRFSQLIPNINTVCCAELLEWYSKAKKEYYMKFLYMWDGNLKVPRTYKELELFLK